MTLSLVCVCNLSQNLLAEEENTVVSEASETSDLPAGLQDFSSAAIPDGILFINGQYLPGPYSVRSENGRIFVNELELLPRGAEETAPITRKLAARATAADVAHALQRRQVVVSLPQQPLACWTFADQALLLLEALDDSTRREELTIRLLERIPAGADRSVWRHWLTQMHAAPALLAKMHDMVQYGDTIEQRNLAQIAATRRLELLNFPLTLAGFMVTVIAFGHLLQARPDPSPNEGGSILNLSPSAIRMTSRSVLFVAALSSLDLVWTLLAWQTGNMKELNPMASQLIRNPLALVTFKVAATGLGALLLVWLRQYRPAQMASWWMCLLCTVLTFRWLSFNSLFMG